MEPGTPLFPASPVLLTERQVFEAFLRNDFIGKPGESRILDDQYRIIDTRSPGAVVTRANWQLEVGPGSNLVMSLVVMGALEDLELCPLCRKAFGVSSYTESKHWYEARPEIEFCEAS